jgi:hypothetical protein
LSPIPPLSPTRGFTNAGWRGGRWCRLTDAIR